MSDPRYRSVPKVPQKASVDTLRKIVDVLRQNQQEIVNKGGITDAQYVARHNVLIGGSTASGGGDTGQVPDHEHSYLTPSDLNGYARVAADEEITGQYNFTQTIKAPSGRDASFTEQYPENAAVQFGSAGNLFVADERYPGTLSWYYDDENGSPVYYGSVGYRSDFAFTPSWYNEIPLDLWHYIQGNIPMQVRGPVRVWYMATSGLLSQGGGQAYFRFYGGSEAQGEYASMYHDRTSFYTDFANTEWWKMGVGIQYGVQINDGKVFRVYNAANDKYAEVLHDGTDAALGGGAGAAKLLYNDIDKLKSADETASGVMAGAQVKGPDSSFYGVGRHEEPWVQVNAAMSSAADWKSRAGKNVYQDATGYTYTTPDSTDTVLAGGSWWMIHNLDPVNNLTLSAGSGTTMRWMGSGAGATGTRTIAPYGSVKLWRGASASDWFLIDFGGVT